MDVGRCDSVRKGINLEVDRDEYACECACACELGCVDAAVVVFRVEKEKGEAFSEPTW